VAGLRRSRLASYVCSSGSSGLEMLIVSLSHVDPKLSSANVMKPGKFMLVPDDIGGTPAQVWRSVTRMVGAGTIVADCDRSISAKSG
jgi:hypothetical protein